MNKSTTNLAAFDLNGINFEKHADKNGGVNADVVTELLKHLGIPIPGYKVKSLLQEFDGDKDGFLKKVEFEALATQVYNTNSSQQNKLAKDSKGVTKIKSDTPQSAAGTTHSYSDEEKVAFVDWINHALSADAELKHSLPLKEDDLSLFEACGDGILLSKLINVSVADTIDERALNKKKLNVYKVHENQTLMLNSAKAIGCNIVNVGADDVIAGTPHLILGIIWQIIRIGLLAKICLKSCPGLKKLLRPGETLEQFLALPADQILLRWFNYQLEQAGSSQRVNNFSSDIKDSENYVTLLKQIAPAKFGITDNANREKDHSKRAELMLRDADKMECRRFVKPSDIVSGNPKLNLAFVANLFNNFPALDFEEEEIIEEIIAETREEKTFRNWMNSLGVDPYVNQLHQDMRDGVVLLQLFDKVYPGIVDWKGRPVNMPPYKSMGGNMKKLENCAYVIELGQKNKFSLVGIDGKDIFDGNVKFDLALLWQLMRNYTLEILKKLSGSSKPLADADIVSWVNETLKSGGKSSSIKSFKDTALSNSLIVCDLIDCIKPGSIDYEIIDLAAKDRTDFLSNAKYAISMARKIGAGVYALPEDLVEVNPKMVMTIFACLMAASYSKK